MGIRSKGNHDYVEVRDVTIRLEYKDRAGFGAKNFTNNIHDFAKFMNENQPLLNRSDTKGER